MGKVTKFLTFVFIMGMFFSAYRKDEITNIQKIIEQKKELYDDFLRSILNEDKIAQIRQ